MPDSNAFNCPTCGASLTPPAGGTPGMNCPFCNNSVTIPAALRANAQDRQADDGSSRKKAILHELMRLVGSGDKTGAIKLYREQFDTSLTQARQAIDALDNGEGVELPNPAGAALPDVDSQPVKPPSRYSENDHRNIPQPRKTNSIRRVIFILALVAIILVIGATGVFFVAQTLSGDVFAALPTIPPIQLNPPDLIADPAITLAAGDGPPDIVLEGRHYNTDPSTSVLVRISAENGKILWESEPITGKSPSLRDLTSDKVRIYTVIQDQLTAYQASDGKKLWNVTLSDELDYCVKARGISCLKVYKDTLLALCKDGALQAFAASTGKLLWNRDDQISLSSGAGILLIKDQVVAFEQNPDRYYSLLLLDPTTGRETGRLTTDGLYAYNPVYYDPTGQNIYLVFGSSVEKWGLQGAKPERVWQATPTDHYASNYSKGLLTSDSLYINFDNVTSAIDTRKGDIRFTLGLKDYVITPLAAQGDRMLVLAQKTRGTNRYELWGVDTASGNKVWSINFDKNQPANDFFGGGSETSPWFWQLRGINLLITQFKTGSKTAPDQIDMQTYQIEDGKKIGDGSATISGSTGYSFSGGIDVIGSQGGVFWMVFNSQLFAINPEKGQVRLVGP
jgi:hypothetical protein